MFETPLDRLIKKLLCWICKVLDHKRGGKGGKSSETFGILGGRLVLKFKCVRCEKWVYAKKKRTS